MNITKIATLAGNISSIYSLLNDPERNFIVYSGSGDGKVIQWDLNDLSKGVRVAQVPASVLSLLLLPGNERMLIGQMQGGIHVVNLAEKKEERHLAYHSQGVFDLQYNRDKQQILSAGGDGIVGVLKYDDFNLTKSLPISQKSIRQIAFHPQGKLIALGCSDNSAYITTSESYSIIYQLNEHQSSVFSVCFSPDGKYLLTGSRDALLRIWETESFSLLQAIPAHLFTINSIAYSPDGKYFATASRDKTIKIWDAENFSLLKVIDKEKFDGHVNSVNKLVWTSHDNLLVSCSDDRSIMVWKIAG